MLSANLSIFKQKVKSTLEKAAEEAYMTSYSDTSDKDSEEAGGNLGSLNGQLKKDMQDAAKKFAKKFAEEAYSDLCDAIDAHIKSMDISLIHSPMSLLTATGVPVTGALTITTPATASLQIL